MKKIFCLLFLLPSLLAEDGGTYYQKVGAQALNAVKCDWRTLLADWEIDFLPARPGYLGMAYKERHQINIWIRPRQTPAEIAGVIVHELAHRVDLTVLTSAQRAEWYRLRGIGQNTPWYPPPITTDYNTGAGDFAECTAWTFQGPTVKFKSRLGPPPTPAQQQTIRKWLAQDISAEN